MPDQVPTSVSEAVRAENLYLLPEPKPITHPFRPREKMRRRGARALTDTELLAVILGDFNRAHAEALVRKHGIRGLAVLTVPELCGCPGIGEVQALRLWAVYELHRRLVAHEHRARPRLQAPRDVYAEVHDIRRLRKEHLVGLYLDAQNGLIHRETLSVGSLNTTRTHPREILLPGIEHVALGFILAHNHPSGGLEPSAEDLEFTAAVKRAGGLMGIELYDHLIVAESGYTSLRERGCL